MAICLRLSALILIQPKNDVHILLRADLDCVMLGSIRSAGQSIPYVIRGNDDSGDHADVLGRIGFEVDRVSDVEFGVDCHTCVFKSILEAWR